MAVRHGLIGVGGFGRQHLHTILTLEDQGLVSLAAISDPAISQMPEVEAMLAARGIRIYRDYREMLAREEEMEAITIAAPIPCHAAMARACLERGLFIYLEKPPVPLLEQLDDLIQADAGRRIIVGFHMLESAWNRRLKQWLVDGAFGEVTDIRVAGCWPRTDAYYQRARWAGRMMLEGEPVFDGPATNALAHLIHNVMFLGSSAPGGFAVPREVRGELYRARPIEGYDTACLNGRLNTGSRFSVALSHASTEAVPFEIHLLGTKGWARISADGCRLEGSWGTAQFLPSIEEDVAAVYRKFFHLVSGEGPFPATFLPDTRGYVLATNAMLLSSGGISSIDETWVRREEAAGGIYHVEGLAEAIRQSLRDARSFREQGLPWAVETKAISILEADFSRARSLLAAPAVAELAAE